MRFSGSVHSAMCAEIRKVTIGVCGTGKIGACLATLTVGNGFNTVVVGRSRQSIARCTETISANFDFLESAGKVTLRQKENALALLHTETYFERISEASFVMEAVPENLETKRSLYHRLEEALPSSAIIASCTSAITSDKLFHGLKFKERFLIAHPFQPAHLQPFVEIVPSKWTSAEAVSKTKDLLEYKLKRRVVVLGKEIPGFLVNRIAQAMFRECIYMVEQGVAQPGDIDKAVKYAVGIRYASIGLLEYFDDVGFELEKNIAGNVYPTLCGTHEVQERVEQGLVRGASGMTAGAGFYEWTPEAVADYDSRKASPLLELFNWDMP